MYIPIYTLYHTREKEGVSIKIVLNAASDKPMYEQIKEAIRQAVFNSEIKNNEMLPSVRQLSAELNVSAITVKRAYSDLEHEGLTYTSAGKGTFVKAPDKTVLLNQYRQKKIESFLEMVKILIDEGISAEELIQAIKQI